MTFKLPTSTKPLSQEASTILAPLTEKYGFTPNILAQVGTNPNALGAVLAYAGAFDQDAGGLSPEERHIVLIAASDENDCVYCRAAHATAGNMSGLKSSTIKAILNSNELGDARLDALVALVRDIVAKRGWAEEITLKNFLEAGYGPEQLIAVIHGVAYKTFTNYVNHIFDVKVDEPFAATLDSITA